MLKSKMVIPPWYWGDYYAIGMMIVLAPFAIFVWIFFSLAFVPLLAAGKMQMACLKAPADIDDSKMFKVVLALTTPYALFLYCISAFYWWFCFFAIMFMSLPALFVRVFFLCQVRAIAKNFRLLWPWAKFNHFSYDMLARAVMGQVHRQSLCEFLFGKGIKGGFAANVAYIPLIKYAWQANPFLHILEEVFINQWTPPIKSMPKEEIIKNVKIFVSRYKHEPDERKEIDHVKFAAHYPWGKSLGAKPDSVIGLQFPDASKMINMTTTIHSTPDMKHPLHTPGKNCRSETGAQGVYIVELNWLSHHFLTGYVEVNFRKDRGLEHPMWCIVPPHSYWGMQSYSWVNDLFAAFVPDVVEFIYEYEVGHDEA